MRHNDTVTVNLWKIVVNQSRAACALTAMTNKPQPIFSGLRCSGWRMTRVSAGIAIVLCIVMFLGGRSTAQTTNVVGSASALSIRNAVAQGGTVVLTFTGTVDFNTPLVISQNNTLLEALGSSHVQRK